MGFGCCWQQLHNVGKVNRELGLLHGTSQVCEAVGKRSGNDTSVPQKLTEPTRQQRIKWPSTAHTLCDGHDSPKISGPSTIQVSPPLDKYFVQASVEKILLIWTKFDFPSLREWTCWLLQV